MGFALLSIVHRLLKEVKQSVKAVFGQLSSNKSKSPTNRRENLHRMGIRLGVARSTFREWYFRIQCDLSQIDYITAEDLRERYEKCVTFINDIHG